MGVNCVFMVHFSLNNKRSLSSRERYDEIRNCLRSFHLPKGEKIGILHGFNDVGFDSLFIAKAVKKEKAYSEEL